MVGWRWLASWKDSAEKKGVARPQMHIAEALEACGLKSALHLPELGMAGMLRCRVRNFTDGAVIGSRAVRERR